MKDITYRLANKPYYNGPNLFADWEELSFNLSTDQQSLDQSYCPQKKKRFIRTRSKSKRRIKSASSLQEPQERKIIRMDLQKENAFHFEKERQKLVLSPSKLGNKPRIIIANRKSISLSSSCQDQSQKIRNLEKRLAQLENAISMNSKHFQQQILYSKESNAFQTRMQKNATSKNFKRRLIDRILQGERHEQQYNKNVYPLVDEKRIKYIPIFDILQNKGQTITNPKVIKERLRKKYELELAWQQN